MPYCSYRWSEPVTTPIPNDFQKYAKVENDRELAERYGFGIKTIARMRRDTRIASPAKRTISELPVDFAQHAHESNVALTRRYKVGEKVIRRYRAEQK
jgi:hypothetical protein